MTVRMIRVFAFLLVPLSSYVGCTTQSGLVGELDAGNAPSFAPPRLSDAADTGSNVAYCPTNKCPPGRTTCPDSHFPCDVNLLSDVSNCGACGRACPLRGTNEAFACSNGECVMSCLSAIMDLDCDGLIDNGCETFGVSDENCGACGNKCTDPEKPCMFQTEERDSVACGCPENKILCNLVCYDSLDDDRNCGECNHRCDRNGGGAPKRPNAHYGCNRGKCGALKCNAGYGDCDNDIETGCETSTQTNENCGACGNACPAGQACRLDRRGVPQCMCPADKTYCELGCSGAICTGECVDLLSDELNCGACGTYCAKACVFGTCRTFCEQGLADCDGNPGCEVNTDSDPRNCGACGHACDAVVGQACVAGLCVTAPCDETTGGASR